ncbi:type IV pilus modification protein PilV [Chitinimonas sp. PSY-7]|uniref:type IV pilus modification protein PilV n=1 Tax=Chitinimonas sp. PSY-7 TaxID=3459088 RepID=UPI0040400256
MMRPPGNQKGISLIEMMISLAILAIGLLALAGTQSRALMMNQSAYFRSVAADLAADLSDRIRANRTPYLVSDDLSIPPIKPPLFDDATCPHTGGSITCTQPAGRISYREASEITEWKNLLKKALPGGDYKITAKTLDASAEKLGLKAYEVEISWQDDRSGASSDPIGKYTTTIE